MSVTLPDGRTQEPTAPESGLATLQFKDGSEYGFHPTIQDSSPWNRIVVIIFRTATTSGPCTLNKDQIAERGARMARRDDREYRECRLDAPASDT